MVPRTNYLQGKVKNDNKICLTTDARKAFLDIKQALARATGLAHPSDDAKFRLYIDTSFIALGGVLVQKLPNNSQQALAYFSKAFK